MSIGSYCLFLFFFIACFTRFGLYFLTSVLFHIIFLPLRTKKNTRRLCPLFPTNRYRSKRATILGHSYNLHHPDPVAVTDIQGHSLVVINILQILMDPSIWKISFVSFKPFPTLKDLLCSNTNSNRGNSNQHHLLVAVVRELEVLINPLSSVQDLQDSHGQ